MKILHRTLKMTNEKKNPSKPKQLIRSNNFKLFIIITLNRDEWI